VRMRMRRPYKRVTGGCSRPSPSLSPVYVYFRVMWFPRATLLGFAAQLPLTSFLPTYNMSTKEFTFKTGNDRFTPQNLIELPRPDSGKANAAGDLVLASISKYSFADEK